MAVMVNPFGGGEMMQGKYRFCHQISTAAADVEFTFTLQGPGRLLYCLQTRSHYINTPNASLPPNGNYVKIVPDGDVSKSLTVSYKDNCSASAHWPCMSVILSYISLVPSDTGFTPAISLGNEYVFDGRRCELHDGSMRLCRFPYDDESYHDVSSTPIVYPFGLYFDSSLEITGLWKEKYSDGYNAIIYGWEDFSS